MVSAEKAGDMPVEAATVAGVGAAVGMMVGAATVRVVVAMVDMGEGGRAMAAAARVEAVAARV